MKATGLYLLELFCGNNQWWCTVWVIFCVNVSSIGESEANACDSPRRIYFSCGVIYDVVCQCYHFN